MQAKHSEVVNVGCGVHLKSASSCDAESAGGRWGEGQREHGKAVRRTTSTPRKSAPSLMARV